MRKFLLGVAILLFTAMVGVLAYETLGHASRSTNVALQFSAQNTSLHVGEETQIRLVIKNQGDRAVRLVEIGDGSESGWRTPVVALSIIKDDNAAQHPTEPSTELKVRDCGNVNALKWGEVFRLAPGDTRELSAETWRPPFLEPGVYRVVVLYANRPSMSWFKGGIFSGRDNPLEMWRVQHSTEATAVSNEVVFTVQD
ncbi:MAG: hypothetical protein LC754_12600 [Acidobacteria bacterium]|nr:hypothetical protein [Acidobacteriota bacterium]